MSKLRSRLTYANVMATVAVFIALGGSSYAAISLSNNSVKSKHIAKGAVKRSDLGKNAVNSSKVADGSLRATDFAPGQLSSGPKGDKGDKGDAGAQGLPGADGTDGTDGTARAYARVWSDFSHACTDGIFMDECRVEQAKGVASVFRAQGDPTGIYCVEVPGITPSSVAPALTVELSTTLTPEGNASAMIRMPRPPLTPSCPAGVFEVVTQRRGTATDPVPADSVGFTIVIP